MNLDRYIKKSEILGKSFSGFVLMDPDRNKLLYEYQAHHFFTPASNTKLFTLYASKKILADSIPSLIYSVFRDSLYFTGLGDPSFLHPDFDYQPGFGLLAGSDRPLVYVPHYFMDARFGPGWAWDDYPFAYSAEKSDLPLYGNVVWIKKTPADSTLRIIPGIFNDQTDIIRMTKDSHDSVDLSFDREEFSNRFVIRIMSV
jgi:D-alanyl-D-alanine carboxypeptidase/D-alanyl-D-alanine-endopeptidase (penicillin-binding protein 4)